MASLTITASQVLLVSGEVLKGRPVETVLRVEMEDGRDAALEKKTA